MVAATWDPLFKGANTVLSGGNLIAVATGDQEWVRCTRGLDPAVVSAGVPRQLEITVPAGSGSFNENPYFGMVSALRAYSDGTPGYADPYGWGFGFGVADYSFHNSTVPVNWTGGGHTGLGCVLGFVWDGSSLALYIDNSLVYTETGVTSGDGVLMYPFFGSGASGAPGTFSEQGTLNTGATPFSYPVPGADPWDDSPAAFPSSMLAIF